MKLGVNGMKVYLVIQDYESKKLVAVNKLGEVWLTDDLLMAKIWGNKKVATQFLFDNPTENWQLVFAKVKFSKKQDLYPSEKLNPQH